MSKEFKIWKEGKKALEDMQNKDKKPDPSAKKPEKPGMGPAKVETTVKEVGFKKLTSE